MRFLCNVGRHHVRGALRIIVAGLLLLLAPAMARAEIPALSRPLTTEDFPRTSAELPGILARSYFEAYVEGGEFIRGSSAGTWNPFHDLSRGPGGRAQILATRRRWTALAEAINDGPNDVDPREYPQRLGLGVHLPEARVSLLGVAGFGHGERQGFDLEAEGAPLKWTLTHTSTDIVLRVWPWIRTRWPRTGQAIVSPSIGFAIQHAVIVGSQAEVALSARSDLSSQRLPVTTGLFQLGWSTLPHPVSGGGGDPFMPPGPGERPPSSVKWNWFAHVGYEFPLDSRDVARLAAQAGLRFNTPW
jgi:hypothetical protein